MRVTGLETPQSRCGFFAAACLTAALAAIFIAPAAIAGPSSALVNKAPDAAKLINTAERQGFVSIIVEFAPPTAPTVLRPSAAILEPHKAQVRAIQDSIIANHFGSATAPRPGQGFIRGLQRLSVSPMFAINVNATELEDLAADPQVVRLHENALKKTNLEQSIPLIGMPAAYTSGATGSGYAVAVVDTGVKSDHPFLAGKVILEGCFSNAGGGGGGTSTCPNGTPSQTGAGAASPTSTGCLSGNTNLCFHGTHVAGIATGINSTNDPSSPPNGVAKSADIVAVQVFTTIGTSLSAFDSDIISGLDYIYSNLNNLPGSIKVAAVNMSLGGGQYFSACDTDPVKPAIDNLLAAGVATAIASGNNSWVNSISSPGCISSAVSVGSSTKGDQISSFSNSASMVALMAPGGSVGGDPSAACDGSVNSDIHSSFIVNTTSTYACLAGTSMAAPHVAGAFAALRTMAPSATVAQLLGVLKDTGVPIKDNRQGGLFTKTRIQVDAAAKALIANSPVLLLSPANGMVVTGPPGGSFSPSSFQYQVSTSSGSANFTITGLPNWLTASQLSGTATTSPTTITFTVNVNANAYPGGINGPVTVTFTNTTNGLSADTSAGLYITPANDNFANAATINPGDVVTATNVNATFEPGETNHNLQFADNGGKSLWWKFTAAASGTFSVATCGSDFDTVAAVYTGTAVNALSPIAGNDEVVSGPCAGPQSYFTFSAVSGTTYYIVVDGYNPNADTTLAAAGNIRLQLSPPDSIETGGVAAFVSSGYQGGPFFPTSRGFTITASSDSINYTVSGIPTWLNVSPSSGTLTNANTTITASLNSNANSLPPGTYHAVLTFNNTTNGEGVASRAATLTVLRNGSALSTTQSQTYVAARSGIDTGLCPLAAPCATLNYALSVTGTGGQVTLLDSGIFGPIVLTGPITILGSTPNVEAQIVADPSAQVGCIGALPSGCGLPNNGFGVEIVAGASDSVRIGSVLMTAGTSGTGALKLTSGGTVQLSNDVFQGNSTATGPIVLLAPNNAGVTQAEVYFSNSDVGWNNTAAANAGAVEVLPVGTTSLALHFNHVEVHNASYGIRTDGSSLTSPSAVIKAAITESEFFSFPNAAMNIFSTSGTGTVQGLFSSVNVIDSGAGVKANGSQSVAVFQNSNIVGNTTGVLLQGGATFLSSGNNTIQGNTTNLNTGGGTYTVSGRN